MKSLKYRIIRIFKQKRGETLVEAIVSILLLTILLTTITVMIQTSFRLTANAMREAEEMQELRFNPAFLNDFDEVDDLQLGKIVFSYINTDEGIEINSEHVIFVYERNADIISFYPDND